MTDEQSFNSGRRTVWAELLTLSIERLGYDLSYDWATEREAAIRTLRNLCAEYGDNDWDESLHLADIIEKHLARHLWDKEG